jgi:hypothetical protein
MLLDLTQEGSSASVRKTARNALTRQNRSNESVFMADAKIDCTELTFTDCTVGAWTAPQTVTLTNTRSKGKIFEKNKNTTVFILDFGDHADFEVDAGSAAGLSKVAGGQSAAIEIRVKALKPLMSSQMVKISLSHKKLEKDAVTFPGHHEAGRLWLALKVDSTTSDAVLTKSAGKS